VLEIEAAAPAGLPAAATGSPVVMASGSIP
jgi:hypothetical protein